MPSAPDWKHKLLNEPHVGRRVRYKHNQRCVVTKIDGDVTHLTTLAGAEFRAKDFAQCIPDTLALSTRFQQGDTVVVKTKASGWVNAIVTKTFAVRDRVAYYYLCRDERDLAHIWVDSDTDATIRLRNPQGLRFESGRPVLFAAQSNRVVAGDKEELEGRVVLRNETQRLFYSPYLVEYKVNGETKRCWIRGDTSCHIWRPNASLQDRLIDAASAHCTLRQFEEIAKGVSIDSMAQDLVTEFTKEATYHGLYWLFQSGPKSIAAMKDGLLDKIVQESSADLFFREVADAQHSVDDKQLLNREVLDYPSLRWISTLVKRSDTKSLDAIATWWPFLAAFSPQLDALDVTSDDDKESKALVMFRHIQRQARCEHHMQSLLRGDDEVTSIAALTTEATRDIIRHSVLRKQEKKVLLSLATSNSKNLFHLIRAESELVSETLKVPGTLAGSIQITQKEMMEIPRGEKLHSNTRKESLSLVEAIACGGAWEESVSSGEVEKYCTLLVESCRSGKSLPSILTEKSQEDDLSQSFRSLLLKRAQLLGGKATSLSLEVLALLLNEETIVVPKVSDLLKWKQPEAIECLDDLKHVALNSRASDDSQFFEDFQDAFSNLEGLKEVNPMSHSVASALVFASIALDSFRVAQWLGSKGYIAEAISQSSPGWNILHVAAYYGRLEIAILLLSTIDNPFSLLHEAASVEGFQGALPIHVAVSRGFSGLATVLIRYGSKTVDSRMHDLAWYAASTSYSHVKRWATDATPSVMPAVEYLLKLVDDKSPFHEVQAHILDSDCLRAKKWKESGLDIFSSGSKTDGTVCLTDAFCKCLELETPTTSSTLLWLYGQVYDWAPNMGYLDTGDEKYLLKVKDISAIISDGVLRDIVDSVLGGVKSMKPMDPAKTVSLFRNRNVEKDHPGMQLLLKEVMKMKLLRWTESSLHSLLLRSIGQGCNVLDFESNCKRYHSVVELMSQAEDVGLESCYDSSKLISSASHVNVRSTYNWGPVVDRKLDEVASIIYHEATVDTLQQAYIGMLALDRSDILLLCLKSAKVDHNTARSILRLASCFKQHDFILRVKSEVPNFPLSGDEVKVPLVLGTAESGNIGHLKQDLVLLNGARLPASFKVAVGQNLAPPSPETWGLHGDSIVMSTVFATLNTTAWTQKMNEACKFVAINQRISMNEFLSAILIMLSSGLKTRHFDSSRLFPLIRFLMEDIATPSLQDVSESTLQSIASGLLAASDTADGMAFVRFLMDKGLDIQHVESVGDNETRLQKIKKEQLARHELFKDLSNHASRRWLIERVQNGELKSHYCSSGRLPLAHFAASFDREDVVQWLEAEHGPLLNSLDCRGRTVLKVALDKKSNRVVEWLGKLTIATFSSSHFRRKEALQYSRKRLASIGIVQSVYRGFLARQSEKAEELNSRIEAMRRYKALWKDVIGTIQSKLADAESDDTLIMGSWSKGKESSTDILAQDTLLSMKEAGESALAMDEDAVDDGNEVYDGMAESDGGVDTDDKNIIGDENQNDIQHPYVTMFITLMPFARKWMKAQKDGKYQDIFQKRVDRLARGENSRTLTKRLVGCKTKIWETYLEQKSGMRILWTKPDRNTIAIWYIAKHDDVSRLARLIDDSENRTNRQLEPMYLKHDSPESRRTIFLSPYGNTPLKVYTLHSDEIESITSPDWRPRLLLTDDQRDIVETRGTVLILGRSGTGKTLSIVNRIDCDQQNTPKGKQLRQLFISRSKRLCVMMKNLLNGAEGCVFQTFKELLDQLEGIELDSPKPTKKYLPSKEVAFAKFKNSYYERSELDALEIWKCIRTYIKGSLDAFEAGGVLTRDAFMNLGKKHCTLSQEQREIVYNAFESYEQAKKEDQCWDSCDRVWYCVQRVKDALDAADTMLAPVRYDKLYVDEIQDYTQAEILLFYCLGGPGNLFLAGDPAQSVVEGVAFRFEDVRTVGHYICQGRREAIPDKPKIVNVNFRSHGGILNAAAAVLHCLFSVFPNSAKQLNEDRGLCKGPRPSVLYNIEVEKVRGLVEKLHGAAVLAHDDQVDYWKKELNYRFVYGIREAKGLEFQVVIVLDFFVGIPRGLQKGWRNLLLGRDSTQFARDSPEVENHLKLLYVAITRCISRLYFAETKTSYGGEGFKRFLTTTSCPTTKVITDKTGEPLATETLVSDVEKMTLTADEWRAQGFDNAIMAETHPDLAQALELMDRCQFCFEQINDTVLSKRAKVFQESIELRKSLEDDSLADADDLEESTAKVAQSLTDEGLMLELKTLFDTSLGKMSPYSKAHLEEDVLGDISSFVETIC